MTKEKLSLMLLRLFLLLALLVGAFRCSAMEEEQLPSYTAIPTSSYITLKDNNMRLLMKLTELEAKLAKLNSTSITLEERLVKARKQLASSEQALKSATTSLESVEKLQKATEQSLQALAAQLELEREEMEDREKRIKFQRNLYALLFCAFAVK